MRHKSLELLDGNLYDFAPLSVEEMKDVGELMRKARITEYHQSSPQAPMFAEVNARALAIIQCAAVGVDDVRWEWTGKARYAFYSHKRAGGKMSEAEMAKLLPCDDAFWREMIELSGYKFPAPVNGSDPTRLVTSTSDG